MDNIFYGMNITDEKVEIVSLEEFANNNAPDNVKEAMGGFVSKMINMGKMRNSLVNYKRDFEIFLNSKPE